VDPEKINAALLEIQPDVIILDQHNQAMDFLVNLYNFDLFQHVRLVVVNHSDNRVQVYESDNISIFQMSDFLAIL
jgi:hypothetical protein